MVDATYSFQSCAGSGKQKRGSAGESTGLNLHTGSGFMVGVVVCVCVYFSNFFWPLDTDLMSQCSLYLNAFYCVLQIE